jgi:hypothetical protein
MPNQEMPELIKIDPNIEKGLLDRIEENRLTQEDRQLLCALIENQDSLFKWCEENE